MLKKAACIWWFEVFNTYSQYLLRFFLVLITKTSMTRTSYHITDSHRIWSYLESMSENAASQCLEWHKFYWRVILVHRSLTKMTETVFENSHVPCVTTAQDTHSLLCLNTAESHLAFSFNSVHLRTVSCTTADQRSVESTTHQWPQEEPKSRVCLQSTLTSAFSQSLMPPNSRHLQAETGLCYN